MSRNIPMNIEFRILSQDKREKIHEASLQILAKTGIKVTGEKTIQLLKDNGAQICDNDIVKIPREMVERAMKTVPKEIKLYSRDGKLLQTMDQNRNIYFGSIAEQFEYLDYKTNKSRRFMREDMKTMCTIQDALSHIDFTCSVGIMDGVDPAVAGQIGFIDMVRYYTKSYHSVTSETRAIKDIVQISQDLVGGKQALIDKPILVYYAEPIPPLTHPWESNERIWVCAENGIPYTYMPYSMMGGTAPITLAAALAQNNADVLAGMVMGQLIREGTPYIYGSMPTILDMQTTIGSYGAPEFHMGIAASSEMAEYYGIPFYGTCMVTDANTIDPQCMSEMEMSVFSSLMSRANLVHDVGFLDHGRNISPAAIYITNEVIDQLTNYIKGVDVSDETLLLDVIDDVGPGGYFLEDDSTLDMFEDMWYPKLFRRDMVNPEDSKLMDRVIEELDAILANHTPEPVSDDMERVLMDHEKRLLGQS